jgi:hypothetical protein
MTDDETHETVDTIDVIEEECDALRAAVRLHHEAHGGPQILHARVAVLESERDAFLHALARCESIAIDECRDDGTARADVADTAADAYAPHLERVRELVGKPLPQHIKHGFRGELDLDAGLHAVDVARLTEERDQARQMIVEVQDAAGQYLACWRGCESSLHTAQDERDALATRLEWAERQYAERVDECDALRNAARAYLAAEARCAAITFETGADEDWEATMRACDQAKDALARLASADDGGVTWTTGR